MTKNKGDIRAFVEGAATAQVPMTNYGVALAKLAGILDKVAYMP